MGGKLTLGRPERRSGIENRRGVGRKLGGSSVLTFLVLAGILVSGMSIALADTVAMLVQSFDTSQWTPASVDPSGAAYIDSDGYLFVVDTNLNDPNSNGWQFDTNTGIATNRATGVVEPSGIDYDPDSDTLFISQDDGHIFVFENFDEPNQQMITLDVSADSFDTEDPTYNRGNDRLYWVSGLEQILFELIPVNGWGGSDDIVTGFSLDPLSLDTDWEGLAWDPRTGNLLIGNGDIANPLIYETDTQGSLVNTIDATGMVGLTQISGMGVAPASYDVNELSLWVTDRNSSGLFELSFDGTVPPPTTSTSSSSSSSSTSSSTSTTVGSTTTTVATTTTTVGGDPNPDPGDPNPFIDDDGHVFETAIEWLDSQGITSGCNPPINDRFCPNIRVTRGQMATFLARALHYSTIGDDYFIDDENSVFENAINRLRTAGVTQGCNPPLDNRFCPDQFVTRGEMAAFLVRALGYTDNGGGDLFIDDNNSVFENAIDKLRTAGVTQGCNPPVNDRYCPGDFVTRGQMAAFLKRALES